MTQHELIYEKTAISCVGEKRTASVPGWGEDTLWMWSGGVKADIRMKYGKNNIRRNKL